MLDIKLLKELEEYIKLQTNSFQFNVFEANIYKQNDICESVQNTELEDFIKAKKKPDFNQVLFASIDKKGAKDADIYKKAGIDRRHFSKIRTNPQYRIRKNTAIALALALQLNIEETEDLLDAAGYSLSDSDTSDLVIQFCLEKGIYDVDDVNQALDYFSLKPLTGIL